MARPGKIHLTLYLFGLAGVALFIVLLVRQGAGDVLSVLRGAGWAIAAVIAFHCIPVALDGVAWWALFPAGERLPLRHLIWMRWIGESVSTLVPAASVGGTIVRARVAALQGAQLRLAAGTVLVDLTLGVFMQIVFSLLGLWVLVQVTGRHSLIGPALVGALTGVAAGLGFYFVQRLGMFRIVASLIARFAKSAEWQTLVQSGRQFDETTRDLYARRGGIAICCLATIASLVLAAGETYIALHALGLNATVLNAFALQSSIYTIRSAMFAVPGAIGVQEGGYLLVGGLLGIQGDEAFALSLIARVRELVMGVPGLLVWQLIEGRRLFGGKAETSG